jgi:hypothetical protein
MAAVRPLAAVAALALLGSLAVEAAVGGPTGTVTVSTSGNRSEERETIPITSAPGKEPRVAMSLSPRELPSLRARDKLVFSAELQTTNNCYQPSPFCISRPYSYSPKIGTRLILAPNGSDTGGPDTRAITSRRVRDCDQARRHREHHCVTVYRDVGLRIRSLAALPCEPRECRVNLVVDSNHPNARDGDKLILGIDRPTGDIAQDRGRLNVARLRGGPIKTREPATERRRRARVPIDRGAKRSILSLRLPNLREDEQLTLEAEAKLAIGHLGYSTFVGSQLLLATRPGATRTTPFTEDVGYLDGHITEANGFNCTQRTTPCTASKVGTLRITREPRRGGERVPLYVNYVLRNAPKQQDAGRGDSMRLRKGFIRAVVYPADARG